METIKHNGKILQIDAPTERALRIIAKRKIVKFSDLAEGKGRGMGYNFNDKILEICGGSLAYRSNIPHYASAPKFVVDFCEAHPRVQRVVWDDKGKVRRIVAKLDALEQ